MRIPTSTFAPHEAARERAFTHSLIPRARHAVVIFGFGDPKRPTPTIELKRRLANAIAELDEDRDAIAIVSGDAVHTSKNEAEAMKRWLVEHGIEAERIIVERTARYTSENARFVAPLLAKAGVEKVTLVTERYHMARSQKLLERAMHGEGMSGVKIETMPAPDEHRGLNRIPMAAKEGKALGRDLLNWKAQRRSLPFVEAEFKVPVVRCYNADDTARTVAEEIASVIRAKHDHGGAVLGLATGSTPLAVYRELIRMHREEGLDFSRVTTFNLDEYHGLAPDDPNSYHRYMHENLFRHLNEPGRAIVPSRVNIPRGDVPLDRVEEEVRAYEQKIRDAGGIDIQLLGIGATGHIGFNEPGSSEDSRTRLVTLADKTRRDAAEAFGGVEKVPTAAITMGVGTIFDARRVVLMATGTHKANITRRAVEGAVSDQIPATFLQRHRNVQFVIDADAASRLARVLPRWRSPVGLEGTAHELIYGSEVLLPKDDGTLESKPALIRIHEGAIASIEADPDPHRIPKEARRVKGLIAPGFIDLQNNGSYGMDVAKSPKAAIEELVRRAPEQGVTSVLPTVPSSSAETIRALFEAMEEVRDLPGADVPGAHVEGPWINPARKGAHDPNQVRPIDLDELRAMIDAAEGQLKIVTLAPELPHAIEAIEMMADAGIVASAGHTEATGDEMKRAQASRLRMVTHATNAMTKDLDDDLLRAIVEHPDTVAGVIADGVHVAPELFRELYRQLGPQRMVLVTDASAPAGMPDGNYALGGVPVEKKLGAVRVRGTETLAGSAATMDQAIVTTMKVLGIDVEDAVLMASTTPAKAAHLDERGSIEVGRRADFVILDRFTHEVRETIVGGVTRYDARART
jgi:glucosamine-6-phosphate isomerase/N-acetylglucosamine-6-phosphate deacetylase